MSDNKLRKSLIKGTGIYAIGTLGTKILSFIFVPIYTYYIDPNDMGAYDILISTMSLISPLITLQTADAAYTWIIIDDKNASLYIRTTLQTVAINCLLAIAVIGVIHLRKPIPYFFYFIVLLFITLITGVFQKSLRGLKNQKLFAFSGIVHSAVFLLLNVLQICVLHRGIVSLFVSSIVSLFVTLLTILIFEKRTRVNFFRKIHTDTLRDFLKFGVPLVPNYLNWWLINSSDKYIVSFFLGLSSNGILSIDHRFPTTLHAILALFNTSWQDIAVSGKDGGEKGDYGKVFRDYYLLVFSFLWMLIPFTKVVAYLVMSPAYKSASNFIAFYYLGTVFQSFSSFYGVGYLRSKDTAKAFTTSVYAAVVNIAANLALIHFIGLQASAVSTFVSFFVMWIVRERQNRKELGIEIRWKEVLGYTASCVILSIVSIHFSLIVNICLFISGAILFVARNREVIRKSLLLIRNRLGSR